MLKKVEVEVEDAVELKLKKLKKVEVEAVEAVEGS